MSDPIICDHECDQHPPSDGRVWLRVQRVAPLALDGIVVQLDYLAEGDRRRVVKWLSDAYETGSYS